MATGTIEIYQKETDIELTFEVKYQYYPFFKGDYETPDEPAHIEVEEYKLIMVENNEEHPLLNKELSEDEMENLTGYSIDELDELVNEYFCDYDM